MGFIIEEDHQSIHIFNAVSSTFTCPFLLLLISATKLKNLQIGPK
jgi:hypothetical protein